MLTSLARTCFRHRRAVLAVWLLVFLAAIVGGSAVKGDSAHSGSLPGTDSQRAYDLLKNEFPARASDEVRLVFPDVTQQRARIDAYVASMGRIKGVTQVQPMRVAADGRIGVVPVNIDIGDKADPATTTADIKAATDAVRKQGVRVELSGEWFAEASMPSSELVGVLAAIIVLLIAFGSVVAMGLPIMTALIGVVIALTGVGIIANFMKTPNFAGQVSAMIGIGVGIDYALFIVSRYRDALHRHQDPERATIEAMTTSGRAVLFAGCTVVVSVLGILLMGLDFLHGLAVGASLAVVVAVIAALTLLPALLGFTGFKIDSLRVGKLDHPSDRGFWHWWAEEVRRFPVAVALLGLGALVLLALPVLSLRLGTADASNDPKTSTTHKAYELVARGFGPGSNGPILVAADTRQPGSAAAFGQVLAKLGNVPGIASVTPVNNSPNGKAAVATIFPTTGPQDVETSKLVHHLRDDVVPAATAGTDVKVYLGGQTPSTIDFADTISSRLPIFIGVVLVLSFLILMVVFRSLLVPLKAVIMNLLSIGAAYGVVVAVFQYGWGADFFGVSKGPIEAWAPMMMFAIVFGLSMDYEVFLLSAVREEYERTGDNSTAVADGLAKTARVITAAALIMVFVFGSFVLSDVRALKLVGLGLAVAVAVDASIVRMVLVPATMELLGKANWWLPGWLDRLLPEIHVEGSSADDVLDLEEREVEPVS